MTNSGQLNSNKVTQRIWSDKLKEHGLRTTKAALNVLEVLDSVNTPYSHDDLAQLINLRSNGKIIIDRVTLYRILDRLVHSGMVRKIQGADRTWRFMLNNHSISGYFECDNCHTFVALPEDPDIPKLLHTINQRLLTQGIHSSELAVTAHGICHDCDATHNHTL
ncbi:Fur family transcriptional regulator [Methylocucumis oryzae]|uniref:Ferric uptake regulation protein n=1 Tax=Methylocucumis oryzae TaxID=1632867 RepID=A0A0F3IPE8_9GAMM|nr:transcriptional repressor [Methylocucumis oryzae]KJV07474.1 hypothetical protein VZ94_04485 [Methylocucumis oryzae]